MTSLLGFIRKISLGVSKSFDFLLSLFLRSLHKKFQDMHEEGGAVCIASYVTTSFGFIRNGACHRLHITHNDFLKSLFLRSLQKKKEEVPSE